jgi:hypothetical protein
MEEGFYGEAGRWMEEGKVAMARQGDGWRKVAMAEVGDRG